MEAALEIVGRLAAVDLHYAVALELPDVVDDLRDRDAAGFDALLMEALRRQRFMTVPEQFDSAGGFVIDSRG